VKSRLLRARLQLRERLNRFFQKKGNGNGNADGDESSGDGQPVKCSEFLNELTNYLDGVLDARTKSELDDHLAWCHNCYVVCDTTASNRNLSRLRALRIARRSAHAAAIRHHEQVYGEQEVSAAGQLNIAFAPLVWQKRH